MSGMNLSPADFEAIEPTTDSVLQRRDDEAYYVHVAVVSAHGVTQTHAKTYTDSAGFYRVSDNDTPGIVESLDEIFAEIAANRAIINGVSRTPGDGYELYIETQDDDTVDISDSEFTNTATATIILPASGPQTEAIDNVLDELQDAVA